MSAERRRALGDLQDDELQSAVQHLSVGCSGDDGETCTMSESSIRSRPPSVAGSIDDFPGMLRSADNLGVRVLCVDDDAYQLQALGQLFERSNATQTKFVFTAHMCSTAEDALDKIVEANSRGRPYHLILLDMVLTNDSRPPSGSTSSADASRSSDFLQDSRSLLPPMRSLVGDSVPILMISAQAHQVSAPSEEAMGAARSVGLAGRPARLQRATATARAPHARSPEPSLARSPRVRAEPRVRLHRGRRRLVPGEAALGGRYP